MSTLHPISIRTFAAAVALIALTAVSACSSSDDDAADSTPVSDTSSSVARTAGPTAPAPTIAPEDAALCGAAERIAAGDAQLSGEIQTAVAEAIRIGEIDPFATLLAKLRTDGILQGVAEAYGDLEAAAPTEQQPNVRALADYTAATFEQMAAFDTVDEMRSWAENITSDPAAVAVQEPATAITDYVQETCGFPLTN